MKCLNLGCGNNKMDGFINIDSSRKVKPDIVCNLGHEKIPIKDNSVNYIYSSHFLEHLDSDETIFLLDELYRICNNGAVIHFICPHQMSAVASHVEHKQNISECFFDTYKFNNYNKFDGQSKNYFKIKYDLSFKRYRPKRNGILKLLPFLSIIPCNVIFTLTVVKEKC